MYTLIKEIIDHVWQTGTNVNTTEQQTIFYIAGVVITIVTIWALDALRSIFHWRNK